MTTTELANKIAELRKVADPIETELNNLVRDFHTKVTSFYNAYNFWGHGTYSWAAATGWDHVTLHSVEETGIQVTSYKRDAKLITFEEFDNIDSLLEESYVAYWEAKAALVKDEITARENEIKALKPQIEDYQNKLNQFRGTASK